jgi:hypothetical protein
MFRYLKDLALRLMRGGRGPFFLPPDDPFIGVREPRPRGSGGRSSAAAVEPPLESVFVQADAVRRRERSRE